MAAPVNWDYSHILLQNRAGENIARGMSQATQEFGRGIERYYTRKKEKEQEDEFVNWAKPRAKELGIPMTGDQTEDEKAIRAGYKAVGPQGLMAFEQWKQQQERQQKQDAAAAEMNKLKMQQLSMQNAGAEAMMRDTESINARADQQLATAGRLQRGDGAGVLRPEVQTAAREFAGSPAGKLRASGARLTPDIMTELQRDEMRYGGRDAAFRPEEMMTPSGLPMVQTSPKSWIPDPRVRQTAAKPSSQTLKVGERTYTVGPGNKYFDEKGKPVSFKTGSGELDVIQKAEREQLTQELSRLERENAADATELAKGDKRTALLGSREKRIARRVGEIAQKKARLAELKRLSGEEDEEDGEATTSSRRAVTDPLSYVLGND